MIPKYISPKPPTPIDFPNFHFRFITSVRIEPCGRGSGNLLPFEAILGNFWPLRNNMYNLKHLATSQLKRLHALKKDIYI